MEDEKALHFETWALGSYNDSYISDFLIRLCTPLSLSVLLVRWFSEQTIEWANE